MARLRLAILAAAVMLVSVVQPASAQWPTSCIEANDAFERAAGRHQNVGIYQRVFADLIEAEGQCRADHIGDLRAAFAWIGLSDTPTAPTVGRIDATLVPAYELLGITGPGQFMWENFHNYFEVEIRWGDLPGNLFGEYRPGENLIVMDRDLQSEHLLTQTAALAHEMQHATSAIPHPRNSLACLADEVWAFVMAGTVWNELGWDQSESVTDLERTFSYIGHLVSNDAQANPYVDGPWEDVSRYPTLTRVVREDPLYIRGCQL